jgi:hypothetical protein
MQQVVGMPSPQYIRAIIFANQAPATVPVQCQFKSGAQLVYNIPPGTHKIEKNDNNGQFSTTDAILSFVIQLGSQQITVNDEPKSIEIRQYIITPTGQLQRTQ